MEPSKLAPAAETSNAPDLLLLLQAQEQVLHEIASLLRSLPHDSPASAEVVKTWQQNYRLYSDYCEWMPPERGFTPAVFDVPLMDSQLMQPRDPAGTGSIPPTSQHGHGYAHRHGLSNRAMRDSLVEAPASISDIEGGLVLDHSPMVFEPGAIIFCSLLALHTNVSVFEAEISIQIQGVYIVLYYCAVLGVLMAAQKANDKTSPTYQRRVQMRPRLALLTVCFWFLHVAFFLVGNTPGLALNNHAQLKQHPVYAATIIGMISAILGAERGALAPKIAWRTGAASALIALHLYVVCRELNRGAGGHPEAERAAVARAHAALAILVLIVIPWVAFVAARILVRWREQLDATPHQSVS